ncbi:MAG: hypothetical protein J6S49_03365 [Erysipelotrichaceae bacterium]|nr:hypothetical protein [Erysipelotrichaceae bacterium]
MSEMVNTVLGPKNIDELGFISSHEHLLYAQRDDCTKEVLEELEDYRHYGGNTIMEMSTPEICPFDKKDERIKSLQELSERSGINIIYGAGFYKEPRLPEMIRDSSIEELTDMIVKELLEGRGPDKIKAGFIGEVGSSNYKVYETEEKVLRATGRASCLTGYGISTHTGRGTMYKEQLSFFEQEGADLSHVIIGHQDVYPHLWERLEDYEYIFSKGAGVQFDCFGKRGFFEIEADMDYGQKFPYDEDRAKLIKHFVDKGYIKQIFISCDIDGRTLLKKWGGWGYSHLLTVGISLLRKEGLSWDQIDQITRENPKEFLRVRK